MKKYLTKLKKHFVTARLEKNKENWKNRVDFLEGKIIWALYLAKGVYSNDGRSVGEEIEDFIDWVERYLRIHRPEIFKNEK